MSASRVFARENGIGYPRTRSPVHAATITALLKTALSSAAAVVAVPATFTIATTTVAAVFAIAATSAAATINLHRHVQLRLRRWVRRRRTRNGVL